ncbi:MAG: amino acid ABC transporter permease, partial [Proteobacteria bacterium]
MKFALVSAAFLFTVTTNAASPEIKVGSKAFTEGYLLGELAAQKIEELPEQKVRREFGLGNTGIVVQALLSGKIDLYPEYTGTIAESILHD